MELDHTQDRNIRSSKKERERKGGFQTLRTIIVSSAHTMHDTYSGFISPLLPFLIEKLGLLKVQAGMFLFIYQGLAVLQPVIGHTADRKNLIRFALIAPAITGIAMSLLGVAPTFSTALLLCALGGISSAVMHSILPPVVTNLSGDEIGKGMSFWMVGGQIGMLLGPIMITTVVGIFALDATPWLMIPGIVIAILLNILLKDISTTNTTVDKAGNGIPFKKIVTVMLPIAAVIIMRSFLRSSALSYLSVYLSEGGRSIWLVGIAISVFKGSGVLGTMISGLLNKHIGFKWIFGISLALSAAAMMAFINTGGVIQIIFLGLVGMASMIVMPVGMAIIQNNFPENRSLANGIFLAMLFAINAIAGVATGALYDAIGGYQTFMVSALIALLGIPFLFFFPKEAKPTISIEEMHID